MEEWVIFTDRETGRQLCAYTVYGTFPGELEGTKQLLSFEKGISIEQIERGSKWKRFRFDLF